MTKDVALVLSSGGPRGLAFIGAIEELESRGYNITSIAGTSMGSLVGGIYAAGGLEAFRDWIFSVGYHNMLKYMDVSISPNGVLKGEKVIAALEELVPDVLIEKLRIPYTALAADLYTGDGVIFRTGRLFDAIRASISVPSLFQPYRIGEKTLVDGGLVSTFPLGYVHRSGHDLLVGFNVNSANRDESLQLYLRERTGYHEIEQESVSAIEAIREDKAIPLKKKIMMIGRQGQIVIRNKIMEDRMKGEVQADGNYLAIISRSFGVANHSIAELEKQLYRPDILAEMPFDSYRAIKDYSKAREISERGRSLMAKALDEFENKR